MEFIQSPGLPLPAGHCSQAVVTRGGLVFVSGVLPARDLADPSFGSQSASVFEQCEKILRAERPSA
jgi:enamine deaminase RidA (YjgF/YER057c/UK114 family)